MKIENEIPETSSVELHAEKEVKTDPKLVGRYKYYPGMKAFELNLSTMLVNDAIMTEVKQSIPYPKTAENKLNKFQQSLGKKFKVLMQPNCIYAFAINKKNAGKKFVIMLNKMVNDKTTA